MRPAVGRTAWCGDPRPARGRLGRRDLAGTTVRPVLDLHRPDAVDRHHPPAWMRHTVVLARPPACSPAAPATPGAATWTTSRPTARLEDGGPPGQTRLAQARTPVPHPPPAEDPRRLELPTPRRGRLPVDHPHPRPHRRPHPTPTTLTAPHPPRPQHWRAAGTPQSSTPSLTRGAGMTSSPHHRVHASALIPSRREQQPRRPAGRDAQPLSRGSRASGGVELGANTFSTCHRPLQRGPTTPGVRGANGRPARRRAAGAMSSSRRARCRQ